MKLWCSKVSLRHDISSVFFFCSSGCVELYKEYVHLHVYIDRFKAKLAEARLISCIRDLCLLIRSTYSSLPLQTAPIKLRRSPNKMCNRNTRWHGHSGGPHVGRMLGKTGLLWFNSRNGWLQMSRGSTWGMLPVVNESTDEIILVNPFRDLLNLNILHLQLLQ